MAKNTVEVGKRLERAVVKVLEALGYWARRQPGSGNRAVDLQHDVVWQDSPIGRLHLECKFKSKSTWKTCENDRDGADILVMREARGAAKDYMDFDLFLQLVGSAADRSENLADLPSVEPDKPWITETRLTDKAGHWDETLRRARIQAAHKDPPKREAKPNKLNGRGFGQK